MRGIYNILLIGIILAISVLIAGCSPEEQFQRQLDRAMSEEVKYTVYSNEGFSVKYPLWETPADASENVEVTVTKGYCSVVINAEEMKGVHMWRALVQAVQNTEGNDLITAVEDDDYNVRYAGAYKNLTMISDTRIYDCNGLANAVSVICIMQADEKSQHIHETVFSSARCEHREHAVVGKLQEPEELDPEQIQEAIKRVANEDIDYLELEEEDFSVAYPDWNEVEDAADVDERVLGVSIGVCSVFVNKYNARPVDLAGWMKKTVAENHDNELLRYERDGDKYAIDYTFPYEQHELIAKTRLQYCNFMTYVTIVACIDRFMTGNLEDMRETVLDSAECTGYYEPPTPESIEEEREEVEEEEPDVIEEIEEEIVKTDIGAEFGIDEEMVVYFVNGNAFFRKILRDFPRANLAIHDDDNYRTLSLKIRIDDDGYITSVEDGYFDDPDVTLVVPLQDALNIFSNAQNINPVTLIGFAINVRTEPAEVKDDVIRKVLRGEYS
ncbi:hypothetical protein KY362_06820 [Candidatus Woesearchaeota archaeon]|nr:hypothetical protein [Candidatus Woesearchaeota archaeon]